jgi:hypothetical protein
MILPTIERRKADGTTYRKVWLYGAAFSGKTTLADQFPDPLILNTDGNIKFVTAPYVPIRDEVEAGARVTNRTMAWEVFKNAIGELEKGSLFRTIVVDLLEDTFEYCRQYHYAKRGWEHESDDSFRAWDIIRTDFLTTIRRLTNLDYNIVLISHEDTSRDITGRAGNRITSIRPNLQEKSANKVAGMVDIVARVVVLDGEHVLSFKTDAVQFGGGRLKIAQSQIPLDYDELVNVYTTGTPKSTKRTATPPPTAPVTEPPSTEQESAGDDAKKDITTPPTVIDETKIETEAPVRRVRKVRNNG